MSFNNLIVTNETKLGDNFVVNNAGATYTGPITNGDHITNKTYVDQTVAASKTHYYSVNDKGVTGGNYNNDGATGTNALAAGVGAVASGDRSTAVGRNNKAENKESSAMGYANTISGNYLGLAALTTSNTAVGSENVISNSTRTSTFGGKNTITSSAMTMAVGAQNTVTGSVAAGVYGIQNTVSNATGVSITGGQNTIADSTNTFIVGGSNNVSGSSGDIGIFGAGNEVTGTEVLGVFGDNNTVTDSGINGASGVYGSGNTLTAVSNARVTGNNNTATADGALILGNDASVSAVDGLALGSSTSVTVAGGVALGSGSTADTVAGIAGYVPTGANAADAAAIAATTSTQAAVDVGGRQITSVAAGTADDDAVNVSQLKAVANMANTPLTFAGDTGTNVDRKLGETVNVVGGVTDPAQLVDGNIGVVADGTDTLTVKLNKDIDLGDDGSITIGDTNITGDTITTTNLTVTGDTQLGDNFTVNNGGVYYDGPITEGTHIVNKNYVDGAQTVVAAGTNTTVDHVYDATTGQNTYTVNGKATTAQAGSTAVTVVGTTDPTTNVTDYVVDLSKDTKDTLDSALQEVVTQIDGTEVKKITKADNTANFVTGKNIVLSDDGAGGIAVATKDDVSFNNLIVTNETQLGDNFTVNNGGVYYDGPITEGNHIVNKDYVDNSVNVLADTPLNFAGNTGDAIAKKLGETLTISGELAEGEDATGANLRVDSANGILNLMMAKDLTDLNSIVINGGPTINNQGITNLAAGEISATSTDAVNGSQLYAVSEVANAGWNIATDSGTASNVKPGDTVNMKGDGSVVVSNTGNDVTVGLADVVTVGQGDTAVTIDGQNGSVTVGDTTINSDGLTIAGGPSVTKDGIDAGGKQITNVASGLGGQNLADITGDDLNNAVNVGDLQTVVQDINTDISAAKTEVEAGKNITVASSKGADGQTVYTVATKDEVDFNKVTVGGLTIDKGNVDVAGNTIISGVGAGEISSTSTDAVNGSQLYATNQQVAQNTTNIAKNTTDITNINTTLDKGLNFSADSGTAVNRKLGDTVAITGDGKNITTTTTANGVQVKLSDNIDVKNVNVSQSFSVAEGANVNMGGNVIQNVAPGVNGTDAVNVNQLNNVASNFASDMRKAYGGVAAAMALESAPYIPGTTTFAVGTGYFQHESAFGVSLRRTADNGRWSLTGGATVSRGGVGARIAVTGILYDER